MDVTKGKEQYPMVVHGSRSTLNLICKCYFLDCGVKFLIALRDNHWFTAFQQLPKAFGTSYMGFIP